MFLRLLFILCFVFCLNGVLVCSYVEVKDDFQDKILDKILVDDKYFLKVDCKVFDEFCQ